jgi:hypothetical protein
MSSSNNDDLTLNGKEFEMMIRNRKQDTRKETVEETNNKEQSKSENDFINSILAEGEGDDDNDNGCDEIKDTKTNKDSTESDIDINHLVETLQKTIKHTNTNEHLNVTKLKKHI